MSNPLSYVVISPCRDEAEYMRRTLDSVVAQSVRPEAWVVVDDGSTDATPKILAEYAAKHPWIEILRREDRGERKVGPGVVDAFYEGYATVRGASWDCICKLDMDLDLPSTYFERLLERMATDPRWGSISGQTWYTDAETGRKVSEKLSPEMSIGASKFWRRRCFEQIGGIVREVMWDGIDCHRARMLGWKARAFTDPELEFEHLRPMGSSQKGIFTGRARHGAGQWFMGTGPGYMAASAVYRMAHPPYLVGGLAIFWGYLRAALTGRRRLDDPEFRRFLRDYQRRMLLSGKAKATEQVEAERADRWDPDAVSRWEG